MSLEHGAGAEGEEQRIERVRLRLLSELGYEERGKHLE